MKQDRDGLVGGVGLGPLFSDPFRDELVSLGLPCDFFKEFFPSGIWEGSAIPYWADSVAGGEVLASKGWPCVLAGILGAWPLPLRPACSLSLSSSGLIYKSDCRKTPTTAPSASLMPTGPLLMIRSSCGPPSSGDHFPHLPSQYLRNKSQIFLALWSLN